MYKLYFCILLLVGAVYSVPTSDWSGYTSNTRHSRSLDCDCECGTNNRQIRVVGGEVANKHEFPWIVALKKDGVFYCGASLITRRHILTAAHCVNGIDRATIRVVLADHDRNAVGRDEQIIERRVIGVKQHIDFDAVTFNNDIAVLEIDIPVELDNRVKPACLPFTAETNYTSRTGIVAGWGQLGEGKAPSTILYKVKVPIWSRKDCLKDSGYQEKRITMNMFCAGYREGKQDACQGDSGGPLQLANNNGVMEVIGIVSWGRGCGRPSLPGVYTKITNYLEWINEALNGDCLCRPLK